jgi:hemerythrin
MASFHWTPDFTVGVEAFDAEHRKLVEVLAVMHEAMRLGRGREVSGRVLDELFRYIVAHFAHEERLMARHSYPDFERHSLFHRQLTENVLECRRKNDAESVDTARVLQFVMDWLREHILVADKKYGAFFAGRGAT